ncbi:hypothetical protein ACNKHV_24135 [Shigella flexneri]
MAGVNEQAVNRPATSDALANQLTALQKAQESRKAGAGRHY